MIPNPVNAMAPQVYFVTEYDRRHFTTYARMVTAYDEDWPWRRAALDILYIDIETDEEAAYACYRSHMDRALWIATEGYELLLIQGGLMKAH